MVIEALLNPPCAADKRVLIADSTVYASTEDSGAYYCSTLSKTQKRGRLLLCPFVIHIPRRWVLVFFFSPHALAHRSHCQFALVLGPLGPSLPPNEPGKHKRQAIFDRYEFLHGYTFHVQ